MSFLITAIAFIVIFSVLVLVHEWGHFFVARKAGIKVEEFGFGYPPRVFSIKKGETVYSFNAIPFGGFVKLLGEDSADAKTLKDKSSFISKTPRVRIAVVIAGVVMNFLLAFLLLTIGFIFGIQPLIISDQDVLTNIDNGTIHLSPGVHIKSIEKDTPADKAGLKAGDQIVFLNDQPLPQASELENVFKFEKAGTYNFGILRNGVPNNLPVTIDKDQKAGVELYQVMDLPKVFVQSVKPGSEAEQAGLQPGDEILSINSKNIYYDTDVQEMVAKNARLLMRVLRDNQEKELDIILPQQERMLVTNIVAGGSAAKAGMKTGDVIISIGDKVINDFQELLAENSRNANKEVTYKVRRDGQVMELKITPDQSGLAGIYLANITSYQNDLFSYYFSSSVFSVTKIDDVKYPFWLAPVKALEECGRLSLLTIKMFGNVVTSIFTKFTIPQGVSGPVGIFKMTGVFVQEGLLSLLRFMALLSLSLAIINVVPFPALDGGRLLFILLEVAFGRRVGARFEALIHFVGFVLLILLILAVTYSDIFVSH